MDRVLGVLLCILQRVLHHNHRQVLYCQSDTLHRVGDILSQFLHRLRMHNRVASPHHAQLETSRSPVEYSKENKEAISNTALAQPYLNGSMYWEISPPSNSARRGRADPQASVAHTRRIECAKIDGSHCSRRQAIPQQPTNRKA